MAVLVINWRTGLMKESRKWICLKLIVVDLALMPIRNGPDFAIEKPLDITLAFTIRIISGSRHARVKPHPVITGSLKEALSGVLCMAGKMRCGMPRKVWKPGINTVIVNLTICLMWQKKSGRSATMWPS